MTFLLKINFFGFYTEKKIFCHKTKRKNVVINKGGKMLAFYITSFEEEKDKTKFEQIYEKYHRLMLWRAWQILKDQRDAEDVVHNAFLKIIRVLERIDPGNEYKTKSFLLIIVEHTALDLVRKKRREYGISLDELEEWRIPADPDAEVRFEQCIEENRVIEIIKNMPEQYRGIFLLKYSQEFENREIAKLLGISEALVRKRISRGKALLEKNLKEWGII